MSCVWGSLLGRWGKWEHTSSVEGCLSTTPGVRVQAEEVGAGQILAISVNLALEVLPCVFQDLPHISGGVTHGDLPVGMLRNVLLQIALHRPDIQRVLLGGTHIVHNLVGCEEGQSIRVALEVLDNAEDATEVADVIGRLGIAAVDGLSAEGSIDVDDHVDTGGIEDASAFVVVEARVDVVDADGVYAEALEEGGIAETDGRVAEGIELVLGLVATLATGLAVVSLGLKVQSFALSQGQTH